MLILKHLLHLFAKLSFILVILSVTACAKEETYPIEPIIEFSGGSLSIVADELGNKEVVYYAQINFTDGDGNIGWGYSKDKPEGAYRKCNTENTHDLYVNVYEIKNGEPIKKDFHENYYCDNNDTLRSDVIGLNADIPYLTGNGRSGSLRGVIDYKIPISSAISDTIKFDFKIIDRDGNYSNVVESRIYNNLKIK
ncbi:MAG: hypothetical protein KAG96_03300 [Ichthyobacteriaceae bacterium]|nr:hypothetical protein [Ichthyobacteriaceae bacterium]